MRTDYSNTGGIAGRTFITKILFLPVAKEVMVLRGRSKVPKPVGEIPFELAVVINFVLTKEKI